jgi:hypothetical protein
LKRPSAAAISAQLGAALFVCLALAGAGRAWANDYVVVRGAYYREASTRVIQPMVELQRESPTGLDVGAHFLVDAITSASIAAGTSVDNVFTEVRDEAGLRVRKRWERSDLSLAYRYSAESDYWSHSVAGSYGKRFWDDTAAVRLTFGRSFDTMSAKGRAVNCHADMQATAPFCNLDVWFGGVSYSQVLSPVAIAQVGYEAAYLDGFQGNLYRMVTALNKYEQLPEHRLRNAITPRIAYYLPRTATGFQLHYRFYFDFYPGERPTPSDPWLITSHTIEARMYQELTPTLEVRLLFRYYTQSHARFWCAPPRPSRLDQTDFCAVGTDPPAGYLADATYFTSDPKLGPMHTEYPEVQLVWEAESMRTIPFLRWFAGGTFEVSYGYYFQSTNYGGAHVLQTGYRLPY